MRNHVVLLVGGVGGAKMALGLAHVLPAGSLTIIVNTGDDFEHLGLHISPDIDTVLYTLAGLANPKTGWGITADTFKAMEMVRRYGGPGWFNLGDADLGTNLYRTALLREGIPLSEVVGRLAQGLGIAHRVLPMSDDPVRTRVETVEHGWLDFQEYFVRERWQPTVKQIAFDGAENAQPALGVTEALASATLIVFGPSNPFLSIDPILAVPAIRRGIRNAAAPVVAVSPIIGGEAVKGPAAKLMSELQINVSPTGVAKHYGNLLDALILDKADQDLISEISQLGLHAAARQTMMTNQSEKNQLAVDLLEWIEETYREY